MQYTFLYTAIVCIVLSRTTQSDKFVVFLGQTRSHVYPILPVASELQKYNHSVTLVLSSSMKDRLLADGIHLPYIVAKSFDHSTFYEIANAVLENKMFEKSAFTPVQLLYKLLKESNAICHIFLQDKELFNILKHQKFDYAIVGFAPFFCFEVLAYKLSLAFVFFGPHYDLTLNRSPINPSFMPAMLSTFKDKMTFLQRVANSFVYTIQHIRPTMPSFENLVLKYAPEQPFLGNYELKKSALLHIVDGDILLDNAVPLPPNIILCGGLAASAAGPIPEFIEAFISKTVDGIVIVSFGSIIKRWPDYILDKFIKTFKQMKHLNFIVRYGKKQAVDENVLLLPWLPQNDLLGHPKTKLLVTHCGKNSLFEALYHGIPIIGFPMGLDQPMQASIIEDKGYGIQMDISDFTINQLETNINKVALTAEFKAKIQNASKIFHSRPQTPSQRAAYWIDLVTKFGADHFRPSSMDLPWYSFYMLDVYLFYAMIVFVIVYLLKKCFGCFKRKTKVKAD